MQRSRPFPLFVALLLLALLSTGLLPVGPLGGPAAAQAASNCGCTGDYVDLAIAHPSLSEPATGSTSPNGTYTLTVTGSSLTVQDKKSGQTVLSLSGLTADFQTGFSPNGSGFAVWFQGTAGGRVALYDLASRTPGQAVWSNEYLGSFTLGFSPNGKYFLVAAPANAQFTALAVVNATSGAPAYNDQVPGNTSWGFSPDDDRFVIWTGSNNPAAGTGTGVIILYDLATHSQIWRTDGAAGSVSLAFSPHGLYLAVASITSGSHVDMVVVRAAAGAGGGTPVYHGASFDLYAPPGKDADEFGSAAWGFSPDPNDGTFVYDGVNGQSGTSLVMVNLRTGSSHVLSYPSLVAGWWRFSPCGDVLGVVIQPGTAASVDVALYDTNSGQSLTTEQVSSLNVSLKATEAFQVVTVDGTDHDLAKNTGHATCGTSSGNGTGNSGGTGTGSRNGGGILPPPYVPPAPVTLNALQVSPIAVIGGSPLTGTLTVSTTGPGVVSLSSSNPAVASVPAVVNVAVSGTTTFSITTYSVAADTPVTIIAKSGAAVKTAVLIVGAACTPAITAAARSLIAPAAPVATGGGSGGPVEKSLDDLSVAPMIVTAGQTATGTLELLDPASHDISFTLSSNNVSAISLPTSVTVPKGQTDATFAITTRAVTSDALVTLDARAPGHTATGLFAVVTPPSLTSLSLDPASVQGGTSTTATVTLSDASAGCMPQTINLASSNPDVASMPTSVTISAGAGSATFTVQTTAVTSDTTVTISGTLNGTTVSGSLEIQAPVPPTPKFNDNFADAAPLRLPDIAIGDTTQATMEPSEPLLSGTCAVLPWHQVAHSVWFRLTPTESGVLTVSTANLGTNFDSVLALYAAPAAGGVSSLDSPLGCDNNADALLSTNSNDLDSTLRSEEHTGPDAGSLGGLPTWSSIMHVSVQAGQTYYVQLGGVGGAPAGHYVLSAEVNPSIPLPNMLQDVSLDQTTVARGGSATGTVALSRPAPAGGLILALRSSDAATASVPDSVIVPAGATSTTFTVQTTGVTSTTNVTITASFDGRQRSTGLSIQGL